MAENELHEPKVKRVASKKKRAVRANAGKNSRASSEDAKGKPWTFSKHTLDEAIIVAKAIEDKNAGNPMRAEMLARAVGFNQPNDWRFLDLVKAARMYGLVSGGGAAAAIGLEKIGQDIVAPSSPQQRQEALRQAFHNVEDFKKVDDFYRGKRIPEDEYFLNTLTRDFGIPRDRADKFAEIFSKNLQFLRSFDVPTEVEPRPTLADVQAGVSASRIRADYAHCKGTSRQTIPGHLLRYDAFRRMV